MKERKDKQTSIRNDYECEEIVPIHQSFWPTLCCSRAYIRCNHHF